MYLVTALGLHNSAIFLGDYSHPSNTHYKTYNTYQNVICLMGLHVSTIIVFFFLVCYWPTNGTTSGHIQNMNHWFVNCNIHFVSNNVDCTTSKHPPFKWLHYSTYGVCIALFVTYRDGSWGQHFRDVSQGRCFMTGWADSQ